MEADREWSDRPTSDLIASLWALATQTPTWTFCTACAERLEALEEIRQRVADGWRSSREPLPRWWNLDASEPMSDEVAAVLWPSTEDET